MLPDFPELKAEVHRILLAELRQKINHKSPLLSSIRRFTQHEGGVQRYEQRPSGDIVENKFQMSSAEVQTEIQAVPNLLGDKLEAKLDDLAGQMVAQMEKSLFKTVEESCDRAGTTLDAHGKPMSPELLLELISTMQMDFDRNGNPTATFVMHPDAVPSAKAAAEKIENDPELKRKHEQLLQQQREAWAARESHRKLVD